MPTRRRRFASLPTRGPLATLAALLALTTVVACTPDRLEAPRPGTTPHAAADASATAGLPTAAVALTTASAFLTQTGTTAWTLAKTGAVDATNRTVTWTITATKGTTTAGQLVVSGMLAVTNTGTAGATIGNIAVTLQQKSGSSWTSLSADCADATHGDAATTCQIDPKASSENLTTITENSASGALQFLDANANTLFSLMPQQTIAPNATVTLLFSARFDNTILKLPVGQAVRAEVIVSFGHSTASKPSAANVDINGNGTIDADEAWLRSVPARLGLTVPAQQRDNAALTITDVASNITTTGTVTFATPTFNLGATSGTVAVYYNGGTSGGKITNCATGAGSGTTVVVGGFSFPVDGSVALQACDTQDIGATAACTAGTLGCGWSNGDLVTFGPADWGRDGSANATLTANYGDVYASTAGGFLIGVSSGFSALWTNVSILSTYLPASGTAAALDANLTNPTTTSSGVFGGDVAALKLNIDFNDAGVIKGATSAKFGDLTLCGLTTLSALNGKSVRQFLSTANTALGGGSTGFTFEDLDDLTVLLVSAFLGGSPSTFAQTSLVNGSSCGWQNGDLITYTQAAWGTGGAAALILQNSYPTVYASVNYIFQIGSSSGFIAQWTDPTILGAYLPAPGPAAALSAYTADATSTASGIFGGNVAALKLNIDFGDAGILVGNIPVKFGDLTLCGLSTSLAGLNGTSVRSFLDAANTALGGVATPFSITDLNILATDVDGAFSGGTVSAFAQAHLVNGSCP